MADDNEKRYHDRGWPWYHWHFWPFSGFNNMFTQPLLFDDSLTLLQKVAMLWKKLYDLIQDYEQFKKDFAAWKAQVESALADLASAIEALDGRLTELENCCDEMQEWKTIIDAWKSGLDQWKSGIDQSITNINQTIQEMGDISELRQTVTNQGNTISNHTQRITALENSYNTLNNTVTNLGTQVNGLRTDLTALAGRVTTNEGNIQTLFDMFSALDYQPPVDIIDSSNWTQCGEAWYDWIAAHCDQITGHGAGTFKGILARTEEVVPGVVSPITPKQLTIGRLGSNVVLCKLPFILTANLSQSTTAGNLANVMNEVVQICENSGLKAFFINPLTSADPYFTANVKTPYPYDIPPSNFHTSYLQFMYGAAAANAINNMYSIAWTPDGTSYTIKPAKSIECNVRIQITKDATTFKGQVSGNELYFAIYNGVVNFYFHAENA